MDMGCVSVCQCVGVSACQCPVPEAAYGHGLCVSVSVCQRVSVSVLCT